MIQVFGTKKCKETKKAQRFFQERGKAFQFVNLQEKALAPKELDNFLRGRDPEDLIEQGSKAWKDGGFAWKEYDPKEELLENNALLITPLIRIDQNFILGFDLEELKGLV
jgi:arsenate reductase